MYLLISILLFGAGTCEGVYLQKLTCPYEVRHKTLPRVWCRQSSSRCCVGLAFGQHTQPVDGGRLEVTQDPDSFTVAVLELAHGEGVYWCGVLGRNDTIIKLAEGYFHSSSGAYMWSFARWILLPPLPMLTIFISCYSRTKMKHINKGEELYDDIDLTVMDPQYENTEGPVYELE
uniref:uncharacterized protein n=1 Tax=Centroberyx gerrardi TaxID=166262 RepID=UPI003AAB5D43